MEPSRHLPALDGLRGVAILLVVLTHAAGGWAAALSIVRDTAAMPQTFALPAWLRLTTAAAVDGVDLFFVVSAFTLTLRATGRSGGASGYALRRIARVGPGYWIAGLAYTLAAGLRPRLWAPQGVGLPDLAVAAVFGSAWQGGASLAVVPGGWSVCCEVAFYVALPFILRAIDGRIWRAMALTVLAAAIAQLRARAAIAAGAWSFGAYVDPIQHLPAFLCGVTAALVFLRAPLPRIRGAPIALLAVAIVAAPLLRSSVPAFAMLVAAATALAAAHPPRLLASRAMRRIGQVSYSMYLIHFALLSTSLRLAERVLPSSDWRTMVLHVTLTALASLAAACVTFRAIERPPIRWAARWSSRRAPASGTAPDRALRRRRLPA